MSKIFEAKNYIEPGLSLCIFKSRCGESEPVHTHDFTEIIYILDGEARQVINGTEHSVKRGDMLFINYGSTHAYEPVGDFVYYNICFLPEVISERIINRDNAFDLLSLTAIDELIRDNEGGVIHFTAEPRRRLESLLADMLDEYGLCEQERGAVLESYMTVILTKLLRRMRPERQIVGLDSGKWQELISYINDNLGERLTLSALAKKCFYNPSYFSRSFKEKFGVTLVDYISSARAEEAARQIRESEASLEDIARACGFSDKSSMYRAFYRHFGSSPGEYREQSAKK